MMDLTNRSLGACLNELVWVVKRSVSSIETLRER